MNSEEVVRIIDQRIRRLLDFQDQIPANQKLSRIGLDSVKTIMLVVDMEQAFDIVFDEHELQFENFSTVHAISMLVMKKMWNERTTEFTDSTNNLNNWIL